MLLTINACPLQDATEDPDAYDHSGSESTSSDSDGDDAPEIRPSSTAASSHVPVVPDPPAPPAGSGAPLTEAPASSTGASAAAEAKPPAAPGPLEQGMLRNQWKHVLISNSIYLLCLSRQQMDSCQLSLPLATVLQIYPLNLYICVYIYRHVHIHDLVTLMRQVLPLMHRKRNNWHWQRNA